MKLPQSHKMYKNPNHWQSCSSLKNDFSSSHYPLLPHLRLLLPLLHHLLVHVLPPLLLSSPTSRRSIRAGSTLAINNSPFQAFPPPQVQSTNNQWITNNNQEPTTTNLAQLCPTPHPSNTRTHTIRHTQVPTTVSTRVIWSKKITASRIIQGNEQRQERRLTTVNILFANHDRLLSSLKLLITTCSSVFFWSLIVYRPLLGNKESQNFLLEDDIFTHQSELHKSSISKLSQCSLLSASILSVFDMGNV